MRRFFSANFSLLLIIFIEGYVVLAAEIIAIRQILPFVGSGTEIVAVIISSVLLPMAFGYYNGGLISNKTKMLRRKLIKNFVIALLFLAFALSYLPLNIFFKILFEMGVANRVLQTVIYAAIFLVTPVYLLAQTIPIISNYYAKGHMSHVAGKILFFSTTGSFLGSIFSTIVIMAFFGVNISVIITCLLMVFLIFILERNKFDGRVVASIIIMFVFYLNSPQTYANLGIISNNHYSNIAVLSFKDDTRVMDINNSYSSRYAKDPKKRFNYLQYIEKNFLNKIANDKNKHDVLVLGAGGFTIGQDDDHNNYYYVDIDPSLKHISEEYFLKKKLGKNKQFFLNSAYAYLIHDDKKYDMIIVDAYSNKNSIPFETITIEFWQSASKLLKQDGVIIANIISKPDFSDDFSMKIDNSFRRVFKNYLRQVIDNNKDYNQNHNILYIAYNRKQQDDYYKMNKNDYFLDR
jgi:spermidine synthase